jgi:chemotaxis protein methyltransferase CheR
MEVIEIGIVETRNIVRVLKEYHNLDFSNHALTSFKRRLEKTILVNNLKSADNLLLRLSDDKNFINKFLQDIAIESTEMFRDPSLWRWLRDDFFPQQFKPNLRYKIWLPDCVSGDELYTLCIVLLENGWLDKATIIASAIVEEQIEAIKSGMLRFKKIDISNENYKRYNGLRNFADYYNLEDNIAYRDKSLIDRVEFVKHNITHDPPQKDVKLIIFRNHLINYNPSLQTKVLAKLHESLSYGGHLIAGAKENIEGFTKETEFTLVNKNENIFKKRT